ncbi:hypothetical protein [Microviridae sp.]|nr:hypothetical protein [Microviridae sp.]
MVPAWLTTGAGQVLQLGANNIMGKITDKIFGVPKVQSPPSGVEVGQWEKDRMDVLFPNLTEYQRAGISSPGGEYAGVSGSANVANANIQSQQKSITKEKMFDFGLQAQSKAMDYNNQQRLNDQNNAASIIAAGADLGPEAVDALLARYRMRVSPDAKSSDYDNRNRREREILPSEYNKNMNSSLPGAIQNFGDRADASLKQLWMDASKSVRQYFDKVNNRSRSRNSNYRTENFFKSN